MAVLNLLQKMGNIRFTCSDILASVEETKMVPESFDVLKDTWVRVVGIPKVARKKTFVTDLAYLVEDPEEIYVESLNWREVWIKVACKNPAHIMGSSDVYINKQGYKMTWFASEQGPPKKQSGST